MTIIPIYMNVKNLLLKVKEWLRRRVAALRSEEVNDTRGVYVNVDDNVNVNDDENVVGANFNFQFSTFNSKSDSPGGRRESLYSVQMLIISDKYV